MRKKSVIVLFSVLIFLIGVGSVSGLEPYGQFDILINRPLYMGDNVGNEFDNYDEVNDFLMSYPIIVPDLRGHVFINAGPTRLGIGARGFSLILETILWPTLTAELDVRDFRFTGSVGGGMFALIGVYNDIKTGQIWFPEVTAAYMFNDWFHLGVGGTGMYLPELSSEKLGFVGSIFARFSIGGES
ncbi:MAG: hypothetical protein R6V67_00300 [Spirochaetia bacterium]